MKKLSVLTFVLFMIATISAQTQLGYVKTKGRLGNNGKVISGTRLPDAIVAVKGHNAVRSGKDGTFSIAIPKTNYYLQNVWKDGYVLIDPEILSKQYSFSQNPLVLVMETAEQMNNDRLDAASSVRGYVYKQYMEKDAELRKLYAEKKIIQTEYERQKRLLDSLQRGNEKLIDEMAKRYAKTDFDQLDEFNRRISDYIISGDLVRADSLLQSKGDIVSRIAQIQQHKTLNKLEETDLKKRQKQLAQSEEYVQKKQGDVARDCYSYFEIMKLRQQYDSAAYYIELRANIDTTNVMWQIDAGNYLASSFFNDETSDKASILEGYILKYYERALHYAENVYGSDSPIVGLCYRYMGDVLYRYTDTHTDSLDYLKNALRISTINYGENSLEVAECLRSLGRVYSRQFNYITRFNPFFTEAEDYAKRAYEIYKEKCGEYYYETALCCAEVGDSQYFYDDAFLYYNKALAILDSLGEGCEIARAEILLHKANHIYDGIYESMSADFQDEMLFGQYCFELPMDSEEDYDYIKFSEEDKYNFCQWQESIISISQERVDNYNNAIEVFRQALMILVSAYGENYPNVVRLKDKIEEVTGEKEDEEESIKEARKKLERVKNTNGSA